MLKMSRFTISSLTLTMLSVVSFFTITKTSTQNNGWSSSIQGRFLFVYSTRPLPLSLPISISETLAHLNLLIYFNDHAPVTTSCPLSSLFILFNRVEYHVNCYF